MRIFFFHSQVPRSVGVQSNNKTHDKKNIHVIKDLVDQFKLEDSLTSEHPILQIIKQG